MPGIGSQACPKPPSRYERAKVKDLAAKKQERDVYAQVTARRREAVAASVGNSGIRAPWGCSIVSTTTISRTALAAATRQARTSACCALIATLTSTPVACNSPGMRDARDASGRLCGVKVERPIEGGFEVIAWT